MHDKETDSYDIYSTSFYVDEQMELIDTSDQEINEINEQYFDEIKELFNLAYKKWGILPQT